MVKLILYHRPECGFCKQLIKLLDGLCEDLDCIITYRDIDYWLKYHIPDVLISDDVVITPSEVREELEHASPILEIESSTPGKTHRIAVIGFTAPRPNESREEYYNRIRTSVINLRRIILSMRELEKKYLFNR